MSAADRVVRQWRHFPPTRTLLRRRALSVFASEAPQDRLQVASPEFLAPVSRVGALGINHTAQGPDCGGDVVGIDVCTCGTFRGVLSGRFSCAVVTGGQRGAGRVEDVCLIAREVKAMEIA
ncbi:MAG: hypothetical protein QOJ80_6407 [Mycobacterium sp.]|jgi:hypothetical protein|nr:hypothetical protein [Mycobacterium sp.]